MKKVINAEEKRELILNAAQIIASRGIDGIPMGELVKELNCKLDEKYVRNTVKKVLISALGKNNLIKGDRRWSRYVIDDLDIAVSLINDHFDRKMSDLQLWELYADIAEYIENTPGVTDKMVAEEFGIEVEFLDDMNSALVEYGTELDFSKLTSNGVKVKLRYNTLSVIQGKIDELRPTDKVKVEEATRKLIPIPEEKKKMIQDRLINIIYYLGRSEVKVIAKTYEERFKENIKYPTIHSLMAKLPGIKKYDELYWVNDIHAALEYVNPFKSMVRLEVALKKGTDVSTYKNMRFSRELEDYNIYVLEDKNSYSIVTQVLDLIFMGASIDPIIVKKVRNLLDDNMSIGHKSIL